MLKINIIAIGRVKEEYFKGGIDEYIKRLSRFCAVNLIELKEENYTNPTDSQILKIIEVEGDSILKKLKGEVVSMCIEGEKISSKQFADYVKTQLDKGQELTFVIGGSYGLDKRVKDLSSKKLSFSHMTFPHTMFRLMFVEQLYRAFTIINNTSYHK